MFEDIIARIKANDESIADSIDTLPESNRVSIREICESRFGDIPMPRNLYYNYQLQHWF